MSIMLRMLVYPRCPINQIVDLAIILEIVKNGYIVPVFGI